MADRCFPASTEAAREPTPGQTFLVEQVAYVLACHFDGDLVALRDDQRRPGAVQPVPAIPLGSANSIPNGDFVSRQSRTICR